MTISRKRKKELKRLKNDASDLWAAQQELLEHANSVAREASRQLSAYSREQIAPRIQHGYEERVQPVIHKLDAATVDARRAAKRGLDNKVLPAVGGAIGSVLALGDVAKDARVRAAIQRIQPKAVAPAKKGPGVGSVIAITAGVLAAAGVAYAVWQTFRADDELWVADDEDA